MEKAAADLRPIVAGIRATGATSRPEMLDLRRQVAYGGSRTNESEIAAMPASPEVKQLTDTIKSLSNEDIDKLANVVRRERKRRGLKTKKAAQDQGGSGPTAE